MAMRVWASKRDQMWEEQEELDRTLLVLEEFQCEL